MHVRNLFRPALLSLDWVFVADIIQSIATVALMEERSPVTPTGSKADPFSPESQAKEKSLWDREDLCVRYIIEEGKLNMLLRLLYDFKMLKTQIELGQISITEYVLGLETDRPTLEHRMGVFEQALGHVLKCCFQSVESLQTCDIPLLITHISEVLSTVQDRTALPRHDREVHSMQEALVMHYLVAIMRKIDQLQEDTVMQLLEQKNIVPGLIKMLDRYSAEFRPEDVMLAFEFLSRLMETEAFLTYKDNFLRDDEHKQMLVRLYETHVQPLLRDYSVKKELRALSDQIVRIRSGK